MAETNDRLLALWIGLGMIIIFPTMLYEPQYLLPALFIGAAVMLVPILFQDTIVRLIMSEYMHLTVIDNTYWYTGTNQHWFFEDYTENLVDGMNHVILLLAKGHSWNHPKYGTVWRIELIMKGSFASRVWLKRGWAAAFQTAFRNGQTDRIVTKEQVRADKKFDEYNGVIPCFKLLFGGRDGEDFSEVIEKYYTPKTNEDLFKQSEESEPKRILEILQADTTIKSKTVVSMKNKSELESVEKELENKRRELSILNNGIEVN